MARNAEKLLLWHLLPAIAACFSVKLPNGDFVKGESFKSETAVGSIFHGIRYASPQGPHNRFRLAEPFVKGPDSPPLQMPQPLPSCGTDNTTSFREDCLYLSIWKPKGSRVAGQPPRPVMVHIHPGALHKLSPMSGGYNWMHWATQTQTIVVGISFRLGIFGHYASEELDQEQDGRIGNNGFLDQRLALQWIQNNIGVFGGDSSRVYLFGLSSGALACVWHAASPGSTGLFHGCIAESGPGGENYYQAKTDSFRFWSWFTRTFFGCATLACVRAVDATALNIFIGNDTLGSPDWGPGTFPAFPYAGLMDGVDIPAYPISMARDGACEALNCSIGRVPLILASTAEECHSFMARVITFIPTLSHFRDQQPRGLMQAVGKEHAAAFADWFGGWRSDSAIMDLACDMYPAWMYESGGALLSYMYRDQRYSCPQQRLFRNWNSWKSGREGTAPAYFVFNQRGKRQGRMAMHGWLYEGVLDFSYVLVPQFDSVPIRAYKFPVSYRDRTSARDPPSLDTCDAWEGWHGGTKPLFLPHAELHKDTRPRTCNQTTATKPPRGPPTSLSSESSAGTLRVKTFKLNMPVIMMRTGPATTRAERRAVIRQARQSP